MEQEKRRRGRPRGPATMPMRIDMAAIGRIHTLAHKATGELNRRVSYHEVVNAAVHQPDAAIIGRMRKGVTAAQRRAAEDRPDA